MRARRVDVLVVGGGPAGLSAAAELARAGASVEVVERERELGGVPRHCDHQGFGLRDLRRPLSGPGYARRLAARADTAGATLRAGVSVTGWESGALELTSSGGLERVTAAAVVLATGARERPRAARLIPGDRPDGVLTTGELQQVVALEGLRVGSRAVIVGAEHVSYSALATLRHGGARPVAMLTEAPRHGSYAGFAWGARVVLRVPLLTSTRLVEIVGRERVEAVEVATPSGRRRIPCDTVVLTAAWIPDHELARSRGVPLDQASLGPLVDTAGRTPVAGVFAAGNLVHPGETGDVAALGGRAVSRAVLVHLAGAPWPVPIPLVAGTGLAWAAPGLIDPTALPARGRVVLRGTARVARDAVVVRQGERLLWHGRPSGSLVPGRSASIPAGWIREVDPEGGPVRIGVGSPP